jgi:hypothetical protein
VTALVVAAWFTVWTRTAEVLGVKLLLPPFDAVTESPPVGSALAVKLADPALSEAVPSEVEPS